MTPLFQAIFACGLASACYARLRSATRPSIPNLQKRIYTTHSQGRAIGSNIVAVLVTILIGSKISLSMPFYQMNRGDWLPSSAPNAAATSVTTHLYR